VSRRVVLSMCAACVPVLVAATLLLSLGHGVAHKVGDVLLILVGVTVVTALVGGSFRSAAGGR
jgi:hypothetical protein